MMLLSNLNAFFKLNPSVNGSEVEDEQCWHGNTWNAPTMFLALSEGWRYYKICTDNDRYEATIDYEGK